MDDDQDRQRSDANADLEREIREGRKFSSLEAVARMAGPGAMKGASPVSRVQQAETEIGTWLRSHVADPTGALPLLLVRHLKGSALLLDNLDQPLRGLSEQCRQFISSEFLLKELVREMDMEWGQTMDERPYFDKAGSPPHPKDPYTIESVRRALGEIVQLLIDN
jgi:hypothetical protein